MVSLDYSFSNQDFRKRDFNQVAIKIQSASWAAYAEGTCNSMEATDRFAAESSRKETFQTKVITCQFSCSISALSKLTGTSHPLGMLSKRTGNQVECEPPGVVANWYAN